MKQENPQKKGRKGSKPASRLLFHRSFVLIFLRMLFISFIWGICILSLVVLWFSYDLPQVNQLASSSRKPGVTIYTQDGSVIGTYGDIFEDVIRVEELPPYVPQAIMAVEDRRFYHHFGLDFIGLGRAAYVNYHADRVVQGGSTLTQQLAKNFLLNQGLYSTSDRSLRRKIQEAIMAVWLEWTFTKDQILSMYLNRVYLGAGTYGIDAAARKYFNKSARLLTVYESAVIAGLLKAPSKYSPVQNPEKAKERAKVVLELMVAEGFIRNSGAYLEQANNTTYAQEQQHGQIRYFTDWVYKNIPNYIGPVTQDLVVVVTLDLAMQKAAEAASLAKFHEMSKDLKTSQIALVTLGIDGAVKAMIGGVDYNKTQYNHADTLRQPGSSFKLFVYLAAIEHGLDPDYMIDDTPFHLNNWHPSNFKYVSKGLVSLREAFMLSANSVSIRLAQQVGLAAVSGVAKRLGVQHKVSTAHLSVALGTSEITLLELTNAVVNCYHGKSVMPYGILEIRDKNGNVLYQRQDQEEEVVVQPHHVNQMKDLFVYNVKSGTGRRAYIGIPQGGKTGSNGNLDAWFVGYGDVSLGQTYVTGVWTGNSDNKEMAPRSMGGVLPAMVWAEYYKTLVHHQQNAQTQDVLPVNNSMPPVNGTHSESGVAVLEKPPERPRKSLDGLIQNLR